MGDLARAEPGTPVIGVLSKQGRLVHLTLPFNNDVDVEHGFAETLCGRQFQGTQVRPRECKKFVCLRCADLARRRGFRYPFLY